MDESHICNENEDNRITLQTEDGEIDCTVIGIFSVDGREGEYIAMVPDDSEEDVLIYGYEEYRDGSISLHNIESDEEYDDVEEVLTELYEDALAEVFGFDDEECGDVEVDEEFIYEDD